METDDLLCSRNARLKKDEEGVARCPSCSQNAHARKVLVRCAQYRATLAAPLTRDEEIERPSLGLVARLGVPVGGRVRKLRAVEDQSVPIPKEIPSELGGVNEMGPTSHFVRTHFSYRSFSLPVGS